MQQEPVTPGSDLSAPLTLALGTPLREYPPLADRKAGALLTANGLILSVVVFLGGSIAELAHGSAIARWLIVAMVGALVVLVITGGCWAYTCIVTPLPSPPNSLAFFRHIASLSREQYLQTMGQIDYQRVLADVLHFNYSLAVQSARKFARVNRSVRCFQVALGLWLAILTAAALGG
jgi:hypothetical protein